MPGEPSAAARPACRYLAISSSSENGSIASGSIHGPSSSTVTVRPAAASAAEFFAREEDERRQETRVLADRVDRVALDALEVPAELRFVVPAEALADERPRAEHQRLGRDAHPQVLGHGAQRRVDVRNDL